jgi:carboxylesterase type B
VLPGSTYKFGTLLLFGVPVPADPAVAANVMDFWTRFARTENPDGSMNVTWPKYTREAGQYLDIGNIPAVKSGN